MQETEEKATVTKPNGKKWGIFGAIAVIAIALLIGIGTSYSPSGRLRKQLDLGQKYLEEMKYEEAVVAFNNAIEIDPMSVDAYLGLVEVYIRTGDFETALSYAQKGYDLTGDERLKEKIDMIESGNVTASNGWVMKMSKYDHGELMWYLTYTYDLQGRKKTTTLYNGANQLVESGDWQYDEKGNELVVYSYLSYNRDDPLSVRMDKWEYQYDVEGRVSGIQKYDSLGALMGFEEYEYDAQDRKIVEKWYDVTGALTGSEEYEYDAQDRKVVENYYDAAGVLNQSYEYEYDAEDRQIGRKDYGGSGNLLGYYQYEYDAEGKWTGTKEYDASGNLIGETKAE